jgi:hypothetical protein
MEIAFRQMHITKIANLFLVLIEGVATGHTIAGVDERYEIV